MALITPLFLLGLLAIGLPIWLHRLQTHATEREKFSSTMFMQPAQQRIHIQRKLKYLLLMALRIAFLALLAFAFARPVFFTSPEAAVTEDTTHHVIVVDSSFSMTEGDSFQQALGEARQVVAGMAGDDIASLYAASESVTEITPATADPEALNAGLDSLAPDRGRLDIGAMISSLDSLIEASQAQFVIHFISDYQQTGQAVRFADMVPDVINGRPVALDTRPVKTEQVQNWAVSAVTVTGEDTVQAGLTNYGAEQASAEKTVSLEINGTVQQTGSAEFTAGPDGIDYFTFEGVTFAGGDNRINVRIEPNDTLPGDDIRHAVFDNSPPAPVLLLTADPESLAVTYITAALETAPRGYSVEVVTMNDLDPRILQRYPWIVIDDIGAVPTPLQQPIRDYISDGGAVLTAAGPRSQGLAALPVGGQTFSGGLNLNQNGDRTIQQVDSAHPALSSAAGWNNLNISRVLPIAAAAADDVLIRLTGGVPFLLEQTIGQGRFMLFNTSLDNTWSDLPVRPLFVTFMAEAARYLSNEELLVKEQTVNSFLQIGQGGAGAVGQVFDPAGNSLLSLEATTRAQNIQLRETGFYRIVTPSGENLVAVNPDPRESDLALMDNQALQNWRTMVAGSAGATELVDGMAVNVAEQEPAELEFWRVLLALLALIVILESILGNRYLSFRSGST